MGLGIPDADTLLQHHSDQYKSFMWNRPHELQTPSTFMKSYKITATEKEKRTESERYRKMEGERERLTLNLPPKC